MPANLHLPTSVSASRRVPIGLRARISFFGDFTGKAELFHDHKLAGLLDDSSNPGAKDFVAGTAEEVTRIAPSTLILRHRDPKRHQALFAPTLADKRERQGARFESQNRLLDPLIGVPKLGLVLRETPRRRLVDLPQHAALCLG